MVEINNQRKAFLDMLAWSEGTDNGRQKTRNHGYDVIVGGAIYWLLRSPCNSLSLTLNSNQQAPDATSFFPRWWGCSPPCQATERLSPKSQDAVALQIKERALYLWLIVVITVRQSTVAAISGLHCRALLYCLEHKADSLIANSKKWAERSERLMYEQSHRDYLRSGYLHHRSPVMWPLIDNVITPLPTKPSATKCWENWSWRTRAITGADASAWCCCARCKYTKELADAKAENDALRAAMLPPVVVGCTSKQSVSQCVKPPPPPAWIMRFRLADTAVPEWLPPDGADHYAKTTGRNPWRILMSSADRAAHIDGNSCNCCEQYTRASSGV